MINRHLKRWNGWGLTSQNYPIPASAQRYLVSTIGIGNPLPDATLEETLSQVPNSRLPDRPDIYTDVYHRLTHARGQSLPDWIALRSGDIDSFPDGVAFPPSASAASELISFANTNQINLIPYGGGTSVVGHINPTKEKAPTLTIDMCRQNKLIKLDSQSRLAWIQAGATGPIIEEQLNKSGFTLGHFPQSFEQSTLGGWIATRSCGQQSYYYGRIEDILAGVTLETVAGRWSLLPFPASAAGPDLKHIALGSEGTIGIITEAIVRIRPLPEVESFYAAFFQDWESGVRAVQQIAQSGIGISMLRLSNPVETETTLQLSGKPKLVTFADFGLNTIGYSQERCLLIYAVTGGRKHTRSAYQQANGIIRAHKGLFVGKMIGRIWQKSRFRSPYLRNSLWDKGYALDTLETAVPWSFVMPTASAIFNNLKCVMEEFSERGLIFSHLSHVYKDGASIYTTFIFPHGKRHAETLQRWQKLKLAASRAVIANHGTISHQHGVGMDHMPYLEAEKGSIGIGAIMVVNKYLDPNGIFNPGKLVPSSV